MPYYLKYPVMDKEFNIKDIIIEILSEEYPLSIRKIHNIVRKKYKKLVSYQAVHKTVNELVNKKILSRKTREYSLNRDYIEKLGYFIDRIKMNYKKEGMIKGLSGKDFFIKKLNSQYEMAMFVLDIFKDLKKGEIVTIIWPTTWPPFSTPDIFFKLKEMSKKAEAYCISGGEGFLDKQYAKRWRQLGMNIKIGMKINRVFEIFVFRDLVIFIYQPRERRMQKYKYINLIRGLTTFDQDKFFLNIIKKEAEIYAFAIKNSDLADKLKQEVMGYF